MSKEFNNIRQNVYTLCQLENKLKNLLEIIYKKHT